jgi:hypothetical protein
MRDNPNNRMKPFVYDPDYQNVNGEVTYPTWYKPELVTHQHLVQFGNLYDVGGNKLNYVKYVTL